MITREEIENVLLLSKLYAQEDEYPSVCEDLQRMMDFAQDVADTQIDASRGEGFFATPLREDEVKESLQREDVLKNAKHTENGYFKVEKKD